jgi:hypothetical protein
VHRAAASILWVLFVIIYIRKELSIHHARLPGQISSLRGEAEMAARHEVKNAALRYHLRQPSIVGPFGSISSIASARSGWRAITLQFTKGYQPLGRVGSIQG